MVFLCLRRPLILVLALLAFSAAAAPVVALRSSKDLPLCVEDVEGKNLYLKFSRRSLTRNIKYALTSKSCRDRRRLHPRYHQLTEEILRKLPEELRFELEQLALKATELREEKTAAEFVDRRNLTEFTKELNRELTPRFGPIFSAQVFREITERRPGNRDFRAYVLRELRHEGASAELPDKDRVKLVVSFGLGWSDDFGVATPPYVRDFLSDMESLGYEVVYLKKNPFGKIDANVERITPQLERELSGEKRVIFLSLCKGTPELFAALARINSADLKKKIIGHVNLSGMLTGTFFADVTMSVLIPKLLSPFLKILPLKSAKDAGRMASSSGYMKTSIVEETLLEAEGKLPENVLTVNVTGAPMSDRVVNNGSPMGPIIKYNSWQKFLVSATDGFIELPHTLVPPELAPNQVTLVLDSSHMLSDGYLEEFSLADELPRRKLYQAILRFLLAHQS